MPALAKAILHARITEALQEDLEWSSPPEDVPLHTRIRRVGKIAFYAFTLTAPPGGRPLGEYKIQLILPDQERGARGQIDLLPGVFTIILGWSEEEKIFCLWDAYAHRTFAYSQNLQVKGEAIWSALSQPIGTCDRRLRGGRGMETVVAVRPEYLIDGIRSRIAHSAHRLEELAGST